MGGPERLPEHRTKTQAVGTKTQAVGYMVAGVVATGFVADLVGHAAKGGGIGDLFTASGINWTDAAVTEGSMATVLVAGITAALVLVTREITRHTETERIERDKPVLLAESLVVESRSGDVTLRVANYGRGPALRVNLRLWWAASTDTTPQIQFALPAIAPNNTVVLISRIGEDMNRADYRTEPYKSQLDGAYGSEWNIIRFFSISGDCVDVGERPFPVWTSQRDSPVEGS